MSIRSTQLLALAFAFLTALLNSVTPANAASSLNPSKWEASSFCKCICFGSNYTILHLTHPDNPKKPCLSCTKQYCLNQNLPICHGASLGDMDPDTATGKEGDVEARCFQRDSPRDQLIVTLFLLTVFGLLLGAGIKGKMKKAGLNLDQPLSNGRRWWEEWSPRMNLQRVRLSDRLPFTRRAESIERQAEYRNIADNEL